MFKITQNKGFHMVFANGWTVSVQFGRGNYCENNCGDSDESRTAEIAAWDKDGNWYEFENDTVAGWVTSDEVLEFMQKVAAI